MGQLLSQPITEKSISQHERRNFTYTYGSMQGFRLTMEDAHNSGITKDEKIAVFGVCDGHGGKFSAGFVCSNLVQSIRSRLDNFINRTLRINRRQPQADSDPFEEEVARQADYIRIIRNCFFRIDRVLYDQHQKSGTTAIMATIIDHTHLIVANTGDSRCILSCNGTAKTLSFDHKPTNPGEELRIRRVKYGHVSAGRVDGILGLSRAFGDFQFKQVPKDPDSTHINIPPEEYKVTVEPELIVHKLTKQDEFLVLACDGIWDCYKNKDLVRFIRERLGLGHTIEEIVETLLDSCVNMADKETGIGFDNMSIIIVALHRKFTLEEWYEKMKIRMMVEREME